MRRILAILIVLLTGLPAITPLFALGGGSDLNRPACCRRDGKHHCMLVDMDGMAATSSIASNARRASSAMGNEHCPYGSRALPVTVHSDSALSNAPGIFASVFAKPSAVPQTEAKRRIPADRSSQKRGPPAAFAD